MICTYSRVDPVVDVAGGASFNQDPSTAHKKSVKSDVDGSRFCDRDPLGCCGHCRSTGPSVTLRASAPCCLHQLHPPMCSLTAAACPLQSVNNSDSTTSSAITVGEVTGVGLQRAGRRRPACRVPAIDCSHHVTRANSARLSGGVFHRTPSTSSCGAHAQCHCNIEQSLVQKSPFAVFDIHQHVARDAGGQRQLFES